MDRAGAMIALAKSNDIFNLVSTKTALSHPNNGMLRKLYVYLQSLPLSIQSIVTSPTFQVTSLGKFAEKFHLLSGNIAYKCDPKPRKFNTEQATVFNLEE